MLLELGEKVLSLPLQGLQLLKDSTSNVVKTNPCI